MWLLKNELSRKNGVIKAGSMEMMGENREGGEDSPKN